MPTSFDAVCEQWPHLRAVFQRHWETPLPTYARLLWRSAPSGALDPLFEAAVRRESVRVTGAEAAAEIVLQRRVAPTAHHVTPSNGPGFLAADWVATAGSEAPVVVLAWSGVALSNTAWSGCLSAAGDVVQPGSPTAHRVRRAQADRHRDAGKTEERISLFPARLRDALLYRLPLPARLPEVYRDLIPAVAQVLPAPEAEDYPTWALRACAAVQRSVLSRSLTYLDLNRLMADYLSTALTQPTHVLSALMANATARAPSFPRSSWFYARKGHRVAVLYPVPGGFGGRGVFWPTHAVVAGLQDGSLCPGLVPSFIALSCVNPIRCLGSFHQVRYLSEIRTAWGAPLDSGPTLIAGRAALSDGQPAYPLDLLATGARLPSASAVRMGQLWARLLR